MRWCNSIQHTSPCLAPGRHYCEFRLLMLPAGSPGHSAGANSPGEYPPEAVVAEKLHTLVVLGERTSRMKDLYDLHTLAAQLTFEGAKLARAIAATFERMACSFVTRPHGLPVKSAVTAVACLPRWLNFSRADNLYAAGYIAIEETCSYEQSTTDGHGRGITQGRAREIGARRSSGREAAARAAVRARRMHHQIKRDERK